MTFSRNMFATLLVMFAACSAYADPYSGLQLSARDISTLAALKVTPEYVRDMRSYFPEISARDITSLYALRVPPEYLKGMRVHFTEMSVKDVTSLYALKVTPEYLKDMRVYFPEISVRDVTSLYALKVPPDYVKQIRDLGYSDISVREITSFYALKVKPDYIKKMRELGQSVVAGQHVQVPDIHIPEIRIPKNIPSLPAVPPVPPVPPVPAVPALQPSIFKTVVQVAEGLSIALALALLTGFVVYVLLKRLGEDGGDENLNSRITDFEQRVNDLQDILLSIDARLDRRLHQN